VITVVGEALVDLVHGPTGDVVAHPGGSPANVAVGLGRLGVPVHLVTRFGRDRYGAMLAEHLAASSVHPAPDTVSERPTSVARAHLNASGAADYDFDITWDLPDTARVLVGSTCVHTGSIAATLAPGAAAVRRLLEGARGRAVLSYDPNCRPSLMGDPASVRARIESLVGLCDVIKASDADLEWLYPGRDFADVADGWLALGPALVVVTRGGAGSYGVCAAGAVAVPADAVRVVDTVGAGDAYQAGLLYALRRRALLDRHTAALARLDQAALAAILTQASAVAAITCGRPGADPPTATELAAYRAAAVTHREIPDR
jgi:fructokinase